MTSIKPKFPTITSQDLNKNIDELETAVKQSTVTTADGKKEVDVDRLEAYAQNSDNKFVADGVDAIKDRFSTYVEETRVDTACGGTYIANRKVEPETLNEGQVKTVFAALIEARTQVEDNLGSDQVMSKDEANTLRRSEGLAGELTSDNIKHSLSDYKAELNEWREIVTQSHSDKSARGNVDWRIDRQADHHAETDLGKDAIRWAFRTVSADPNQHLDLYKTSDELKDAERSWLKFIPFFGNSVKEAEGHLSDSEVKKYLGTNDLSSFIEEKKAEFQGLTGVDYEGYLEGRDLPDFQHLSDPDFTPISTGC